MVKSLLSYFGKTEPSQPSLASQNSLMSLSGDVGDGGDLYSSGDVDRAIVADYPGSVLRIYKRRFNGLPWPLWQMLILRDQKLVYNPIAKCGSSSLRAAMVAISDIPDELKALQLETHTTGLQLGDLPLQEALDILHDRAYLKFTVVRDPFERLVSAYLDKFVLNRLHPGNQFHTRRVIAGVAGRSQPSLEDFNRSISFAEFVDYIVAQRPENLDPHWCPQYLHLQRAIHRVFRLEDLHEVTRLLGLSVDLPRHNATRNAQRLVPEAYRLAGFEIPSTDIASESFFDTGIRRRVESYYALDFTLWEAAAAETRAAKRESELAEVEKRAAEASEQFAARQSLAASRAEAESRGSELSRHSDAAQTSWIVKLRRKTRPARRALYHIIAMKAARSNQIAER